ncbi:MAG: TonB-dependent receptor [Sphingobacteriales bacterium]|nr:MAG: TonB-dependent receptor [Sphingobacteriales bacterium]
MNLFTRSVLFVFLFCAMGLQPLFAQTGKISGKVMDDKSGELLVGAIIMLDSTKAGAIADMNGVFLLQNVSPGKHKLSCRYLGYSTKIFNDVNVKTGNVTDITFTMASTENVAGEVVITGTIRKETNNGLLLMQKNSATVSDGVSAETIKRTPDKSTSDVLKRVSGASIQDNKFAVIRGLNDRYNAAYLNGAPLPSSESDRKAFAFDIFPANMLDNLVIVKTSTPDQPSEFAGGIIQINTKSIPEQNFQSISIGGGYNTITTGKNQVYYNGGKTDFLGVDDGTRSMPESIPQHKDFPLNIDEQAKLAKTTNMDWGLYNKKFAPNLNFQYSMGYTKQVKSKPLGMLFALTYNKTNNFNETIRNGYSGNGGNGNSSVASQLDHSYLDKTYSEQVLAGALANISYKLSNNSNIGFKNLYSVNSDDRVIARTGQTNPLEANPALLRSTARWFTGNKIYTGQLLGEHLMADNKLRINWMGSLSQIQRDIPNLRRSVYTRYSHINDPENPNPSDTVYTANISYANVGPDYGGGMFFSKTKESIYSAKADVLYSIKNEEKSKHDIKTGFFVQSRNRSFTARQLGYTRYGKVGGNVTFNDSLLYYSENEIFNNNNLGLINDAKIGESGTGGFKLTDGTKYTDSYDASSSLQAGYIMLDDKIGAFRLVWGARVENFTQKLTAMKSETEKLDLNINKLDVLPSANLIASVSEKKNLRFSASQTLNRPEYRELAPFAFYDFNTQFVVSGNENLQRAKISNFDLRYEYFPGSGQLFSVSGFYKNFQNPIEQVSRPDVEKEISFRNLPKANNYGVELEFRVLLARIFKADSSKLLNNLTVFTNLAIIRSVVDLSSTVGSMSASRPLQGQSPYVLNAGLQYLNVDKGFSAALSLNNVGQRIAIVGNINEPDIWEKGRTFVDFQLAKSFMDNKLDIKLNVQNILAEDQIFYQNRDLDNSETGTMRGAYNTVVTGSKQNKNGYNKTEDDMIWSTKFGRVISIGAAYKF